MTSIERAHVRRRRRVVAAAVLAASATSCADQPTPVDAPTVAPVVGSATRVPKTTARGVDTPGPSHPHRRPAHIGTALTIRRLRVTAYCETGSRTYTGVWPRRGMAAVKRSAGIGFGATLHVEGVGTFVVTDREPEYGASNVDLYMGWRSDCRSFAHKFGVPVLPVTIEEAAA